MKSIDEVLDSLPKFKNDEILKAYIKSYKIINDIKYNKILCSVSGGADSDIMIDIIQRVDVQHKVEYVWFNTGLEYQATKDHLKYLENKYNIKINTKRAIKTIPLCVKEFGQPFISKFVSEAIGSLQKYGFKFEDRPYEELEKEYPKVKSYLKWWCNKYDVKEGYTSTIFNINHNKLLKEFLVENPPTFKISSQCCKYAKKKVVKSILENSDYELQIVGIRKAEGGVRSKSYSNCYTTDTDVHSFRPIFWFKNEDKEYYDRIFNIKHSDCYTVYGFKRTGCVGCPYIRDLNYELSKLKQYEPLLYKASNNIFKESYEYTKLYKKYVQNDKRKKQSKLFDI